MKIRNKKGSHQRGGFKPFRKSGSGGKANMANEMIPTTRHIGEKAKERREKQENPNSNIPMMETRVIHPLRMAKERADMTRKIQNVRSHRREVGGASCHSQLLNSKSLPMPVGQTKIGINHGHGTNTAGTHRMRHPAQDKR